MPNEATPKARGEMDQIRLIGSGFVQQQSPQPIGMRACFLMSDSFETTQSPREIGDIISWEPRRTWNHSPPTEAVWLFGFEWSPESQLRVEREPEACFP
ncbi:MAG: hypothetical protein JWP89_1839 [Schlesneria sp.]|nr:hypothetical protein [Schlesneria sp.]